MLRDIVKIYRMGSAGIAVSVKACRINNRDFWVQGWHINSETEARKNLVKKLKTLRDDISEKICGLENESN